MTRRHDCISPGTRRENEKMRQRREQRWYTIEKIKCRVDEPRFNMAEMEEQWLVSLIHAAQ